MAISLPRRPEITLFTPWRSKVRVGISDYRDEGTHLDTQWQITKHPAGIVADITSGTAAQHLTVGSLSLVPGDVYAARARLKNETGWGPWSAKVTGRVPAGLDDFDAITVPHEPNVYGEVPFDPDPAEPQRNRDARSSRTQTGHLYRRLVHSTSRWSSRMVWSNLEPDDRDTLVEFLRECINRREGYTTTSEDPAHGTRSWFIIRGRLETILVDSGTWTIIADVVELKTDHPFTIGESEVGGDDPIS